jgi:glycosyltransferase involved in cell wall biosynthesis
MTLTVLTPIYNDWTALAALIRALDRELTAAGRSASILVADDGSHTTPDFGSQRLELSAVTAIEILHLRRNLGHQRAIAIGLAHLEANSTCDAVVVMDGDGEDRPEDVGTLVDRLEAENGERVVFAERMRRSEGRVFAALYWLYRVIHRLLTGERVRVGNFSVIPRPLLRRLVGASDLWNHYAASVFHARLPYVTVPTGRGTRYAGRSQMNFVALVTHGLSAMSVFGDRIGVRLLIVTSGVTATVAALYIGFVIWRVASGEPFAEWVLYGGATLLLLIFLLLAISLTFVFIILAGRNSPGFLPFREFTHYVSHSTSIPVSHLNVGYHLRRH